MRLQSKRFPTRALGPAAAGAVYLGWGAGLALLELLGRLAPNDLADGCLVSLLGAGICMAWMCDPWRVLRKALIGGLALFRRTFAGSRIVFGIDFRGTTPLRDGFPPWWQRLIVGSVSLAALLLVASVFWSGNLRSWLAGGSYVFYLSALGVLWALLLTGHLVNAFVGFAVIHDFCVESYDGQKPRPLRGEFASVAACASAALFGSLIFGAGIPLAILIIVGVIWAVSFSVARVGFSVLWAQRPGQTLRRFDGRWLWAQWGLLFLWTMAIVMLALGERAWDILPQPPNTAMPFTLLLADLLAWLAAITAILLLAHWLRMVWMMGHLSPKRPPLPSLAVLGPLHRFERQGLRQALRKQGWAARFRRRDGDACDAVIALTPGQLATWRREPDWFRDPEWLESVCESEQLAAWRRKAEIRSRRQMLRGLEKLWKRMKRCRGLGGSGFWLGLQHAFILGLARDHTGHLNWGRETTILDEIIGQPFCAVMPPIARYHYRQMTTALQIDLIFVEDGVSFRRLVRVLRMMFEVYDLHGGRMPAREHHFQGLPGVRVILHEFQLDDTESHGRSGYPEPDYEEIGHARVLHVFRDRGEAEEPVDVPGAADWTPVGV
jgi:hypothetical protein